MRYEAEQWADVGAIRPRYMPKLPLGPFRVVDGYIEEFESDGHQVIKVLKQLSLTGDRWLGQPFDPVPWMKQLCYDAFEIVYDPELGRKRRKYRDVAVWTPKKQGKSEWLAGIGVWGFLASGEVSPSVACCASAETQADMVFGACKTMIEYSRSPVMANLPIDLQVRRIQLQSNPNAYIKRLAASGGKFDGQRLFMALPDELHEWLSYNQRKMFGMLRGALALAEEPLFVSGSTVGESEEDLEEEEWSPWWKLYQYSLRVLSGEVTDDSFFTLLYQAPEGADPRDIESYMDPFTNPSVGVTVQRAFYQTEMTKRSIHDMIRYYLNRPAQKVNPWLDPGAWEACAVDRRLAAGLDADSNLEHAPRLELQKNIPTWVGWDASTKKDTTAIVAVQWQELPHYGRRLVVVSWCWERPMVNGEFDQSWRVPTEEVKEKIVELCEGYDVVSVGYDPFFIAWVAEDLVGRGLPLIEWPQTPARMGPATQATYDAISEGALAHDNVPLQNRHIRAAKVKGVKGGKMLTKDAKGTRQDFAVALVMAIGEAQHGGVEAVSTGFFV